MPMQHDVLVHVRWSEHCCLELQGTVYDSPLGHGLGFLRGWRSWPLSVYSGRPRHRPWTVKRTLNLLPFSFFSLFFLSSLFSPLSLLSLSPLSLSSLSSLLYTFLIGWVNKKYPIGQTAIFLSLYEIFLSKLSRFTGEEFFNNT